MEEGVKMTSLQMVDVQNAAPAPAPRVAYELPDAPLAMPEQDLGPARAVARQGWLAQILRHLRATTPPQGSLRS